MMPLRLEIHAFGPYAGTQIIDFRDLKDRKLFLIYGPTGAGKTTVLDAMCYALYGDTSGNLRSGSHMRSEYASPQEKTFVSFSFAIGAKRYRVDRNPEQEIARKRGPGLKKETAKAILYEIDENDADVDVIASKNVNAEIIRLLGFKSEQFRQVVLLPQGDFRKLLLASSSDRQQIMQTLFHTQRYATLQALAKEKYDAIQKAYGQTKEEITRQLQLVDVETEAALQDVLEMTATHYDTLQQRRADAMRLRDAYQQTVQDAQVLFSHFQGLEEGTKKLAALEAKAPAIEEQQTYMALLEQAKVLAEPCRHLDVIQEKGTYAGGQEQQARQALDMVRQDLQAKTQRVKDLQQQQEAYQGWQRELGQLQAMEPKVTAYGQVLTKLTQAKRDKDAKEGAWQKSVQAGTSLRHQWDDAQAQAAAYPAALREFEQGKAQLGTLTERLTQEQRLADLQQQMNALEAALAQAQADAASWERQARADAVAYEAVQALFIQGQAAVLASSLHEGEPCPVCGATTHPHLAVPTDRIPQKEDVERCKHTADASERKRQTAQEQVAAKEARLTEQTGYYQELRRQYPEDGTLADWLARKAKQERIVQEGTAKVAKGKAAQQQSLVLQDAVKKAEETEQALRTAKDEAALTLAKLTEQQEQAERDIPEPYRDGKALATALAQLGRSISQYETAWTQGQEELKRSETTVARYEEQAKNWQNQVEQLRQEYHQGVQDLKDRVYAAGFTSVQACRKAQQDVPNLETLKETVDAYMRAVQQVKGQIAQEKACIASKEKPQMEVYQAKLAAYNEQCRVVAEEAAQTAVHIKQLQQVQQTIQALRSQQEALTNQYKAVGSVYELISGKVTGINFERYVLGALLDEVLQAANYRLDAMSRHRYELQRSQTWDDKRVKQIGLDIAVFDNYTGYARPANTLSGGETFLASLALALGLADVVQAYSGGIHLDTIFIDEGFGTLDGETLDFALKALLELKQGGRLVGIISHVPELRERIDTRLAVKKTDRGSTASFELL